MSGFFIGREVLRADASDGAKLLNLFMEYGIAYRGFGEDGEGGVQFSVSPLSAAAVITLCEKKQIKIERKRAFGVPRILYKYRRRWGLALGAVVALAIVFLSRDILWGIRVTGNENVTYTEVVETLEKCGFSVGARIKDLDIDGIETRALLSSDKISWISINMIGNCADVQIREAVLPSEKPSSRPANVVASRDGQVEYVEISSGVATVIEGSVVRKGDLLISGVIDSKAGGYSITRATGKVYAVTEREFFVEIPMEYERKVVLESEKSEIYITFFSKELKIFKRDTQNGSICDTIDSEEVLKFFGGARLPFGIRTVSTVTYETVTESRSESEAMELAYYQLNMKICEALPDAQILNKTLSWELSDGSYLLKCTVRCIENIGETVEFDFEQK